ncbi:MAG TPA: amidohydrolase [Jatrophihabitans sp.]|jgi:imidazolonepropionase-like amidohydrolase|uniref:amidohydrolase n=1 Tax=Jatrophihabitans sp. TaxID=1932789 RepID=UPI002EDD5F9F
MAQAHGSVAITGGYVVPIEGEPVPNGTVVITDGKITAVGAKARVPRGMPVVDATGKWVLPGFVDAHAHLGVYEEGEGWAGDDVNEMTDPNGARLRALDAINPADEGFSDALAGGVTSCVVKPGSGNPIGGQTVAIKTWGRIVDEMVIKSPASVKSALGENPKRVYGDQRKLPSTRLGVAAVIRSALTHAQDYRVRRDAALKKKEPFERDLSAEVLVKVLEGELPWCQHTHRADDISTAIRLSEEFGYRLIINHATEAYLLADVIAERGIACIVGPLFHTRSKVEVRNRSMATAGKLANAGVTVALTTDHPVVAIDFLVHQATFAVREGMSREDALRAITINPASILGFADRVGSLTRGKDGDVAIWSGDPLDVLQRAERVFVSGQDVYRYADGRGVVSNPYRVG